MDNMSTFRLLQSVFRSALHDFANSSNNFQIVRSVPQSQPPSPTKTLYVLDSSFNPPSKAHSLLAKNAITNDNGTRPARLLLLLATVNADKKFKPAALEDRLAMMTLMAYELHENLPNVPVIDIGITKKPYFSDKAESIDQSGIYGDIEQVHLTGFDTLTRIFNAKYYPEDQKLRVLDPFLSKHRLRATYRPGDDFGSREDQDHYVEGISDGSREDEGMKKEWRDRVEMVDDAKDGEGISSTEARKASKEKDWDELNGYVGKEVSQYIREMELYQEEE
jgi:nicotinamide-nucleotide adenylyltransferase